METGATVYGAVNDIFIHADGFKKSITGPGLGNYLTVTKALAATAMSLANNELSATALFRRTGPAHRRTGYLSQRF